MKKSIKKIEVKKVERFIRKQVRSLPRFGSSLVFYKITKKDNTFLGFHQHSMGLSVWCMLDNPEPNKTPFSPITFDKEMTIEDFIKETNEHNPNNIYRKYNFINCGE